MLLEWDPFANPILTEVGGQIKFGDIIEGVTMQEQVDEFTGMSSKVIVESKDPDLRPRISVKDEAGQTIARALLPVGAYLAVTEGEAVAAGDVVAKIPRETSKTKDITGGLPRVAELFEARKPKETAIVSEIEGSVGFGPDSRGKRRVIVTPDAGRGEPREYLIPKGKHISVHEGDRVRPGEPLMDGSSNPHDILAIKGEKELAKYLVDEVQEVYRLQGVKINDKHIEIIVRQMLRKVRVKEVGRHRLPGRRARRQDAGRADQRAHAARRASARRPWSRCCSASPRRRSRRSRSSRPPPSRRRPRCSPRRRSGARPTTCTGSRRT